MKALRYILLTAYLLASMFPKAQTVAPVDKSSNVIVCILDSGGVNAVEYAGAADYSDYGGHGTFNANLIQEHSGAAILSYCIMPVVDGVQTSDAYYINIALKDVLGRAQRDKAHRYVVLLNVYGEGVPDGMETLINALVDMDVPVIVPAGNEGIETDNRYPSCFDAPICVAAVNSKGDYAGFSTRHNNVDFADVGVQVWGTQIDGTRAQWNGTCMAAAIVTAKVANIISAHPRITEPPLYEMMKTNALDLLETGHDNQTGWGIIAG